MKPVIIIIDVQQDFFKRERLSKNRSRLVKNINNLTAFGRKHNVPIIWVRQEFKEDLSDAFLGLRKSGKKIVIKGTEGSKLLPEIDVDPKDYEVIKKRYSAFFKTKLDNLLRKIKTDTLIIGGINTHACIRTAAVDAYQRDFEVILATDCIDSYDKEYHKASLRYLTEVISKPKTNKDLFKLIRNG